MRRFEFHDDTSHKFWEIDHDSNSFTTRWGRIGTDGQSKTKDSSDPAADVAKQIKGKTKKGYVELVADAPAEADPGAARRFEYQDEKSHKFWEVSFDDASFTTRWGRVGTDGQSKTKDSSAPAVDAEKQVKSKTKKGYVEQAGGASQAAPAKAAPAKAAPAKAAPAKAPKTAKAAPTPAVNVQAPPPPPPAEVPLRDPPVARMHESAGRRMDSSKPGDSAETWKAARLTIAKDITSWTAGLAWAEADVVDLQRRMLELRRAETPPALTDPDEWAALMHMGGHAWGILGIIWQQSPTLAVEAAHRSAWWNKRQEWKDSKYESYIVQYTDKDVGTALLAKGEWARVAALIRATGDEAALATAERLFNAAPGKQKLAIAGAFPERPDWVQEALETCRQPDGSWDRMVGHALTVLRDPVVAMTLTDELLTQLGKDWGAYSCVQTHGRAVAGNLGLAAVPVLERMWKGSSEDYAYKEVAEGMALILSMEAANSLAAHIDHKHIRAIAVQYMLDNVELAVPALANNTSRRSDSIGSAVLGMHARRDPKRALELCFTASQQQVVRAYFLDHKPAATGDLPRVLTSPPWESRVPPTALKPVALTPLTGTEAVVWSDALRGQYQKSVSHSNHKTPEKIDFWRLYWYTPDDAVTEVWNTAIIDWNYSGKDEVLGVLARTGDAGIDGWVKNSGEKLSSAMVALRYIRSPRVANHVANALARYKSARGDAKTWLSLFPEEAAIGLIPTALGKDGENARKALRVTALAGHEDVIRAVADRYGAEARAQVEVMLAFDPLQDLPKKLAKLPKWLEPGLLPAPELKTGGALPPEALVTLCTMLSFSPVDPPYVGIEQIQEACTEESLEDFAWDLFQLWRAADGSGKTDWCMMSLAFFGRDETARKITPLVRRWPGESRHARAKKALDILGTIGTDVALMHLHGISQKLKFKALKAAAAEKIELIAQQRGLTREELADRLVPDLDLDDSGTMTLDFGPRHFTVSFDEQLKPVLRDGTGKVRKSLPKPSNSDDAEMAAAAKKAFSGLKKDARTVCSLQLTRMELGMTARRRWDVATFTTFMVHHPLLIHLVRRLVWGIYSDDGALQSTFRVSEDRTFTDAEDEAVAVAPDAILGIPHRIELDAWGETASWGELFADYEILQPFPQLAREVFRVPDTDLSGYELKTVEGKEVHFGKVMGLKNVGWRSGFPQDAGCIWDYFKPMGGGYEAELGLEPGMIVSDPDWEPMQKLSSIIIRRKGTYGDQDRLTLGKVDAMMLSELIRDLNNMTR